MTRDNLLAIGQLDAVVTALYADAEAMDWTHLPLRDRTKAYAAWVDDPRIGGVLNRYMAPEAARAWIKDGPMKEYSKALRGSGRYARYGRSGGTTPDDIVRVALGRDWRVVEGTLGTKPFHAKAANSAGDIVYVAWDEGRNFKNVVWAALRASVEMGLPGHVVVTEPPGTVTPREQSHTYAAMARRCRLDLHFVREQLGVEL